MYESHTRAKATRAGVAFFLFPFPELPSPVQIRFKENFIIIKTIHS
ncbi:hypothetical protein PMI05_04169 [Brevibacillus sp. BC25]|nr:hypothetical protein PMI05_04169 [Brevibacillus sp. BC25]